MGVIALLALLLVAAFIYIYNSNDSVEAGETYEIKVAALCYHRFHTEEEVANGYEPSQYSIYVDEFEEHLRYLREHDIRVITVSELLAFIEGEIDLPEKCMLITEDDCTRSFYNYAVPLLREYGMTANVAVIGNRIDLAEEDAAWRELYCVWDEISEMADSGVAEFGSHTYYLHDTENGRTGTMLKSDEGLTTYKNTLLDDMRPLNKKLEKYCGYAPRFFAYPYYAVSMPSIPTMRDELGYEILFCGHSDSVYRYCGESVHLTNYNPFEKGREPADSIIKRYTPRSGDDFEALMKTIYG